MAKKRCYCHELSRVLDKYTRFFQSELSPEKDKRRRKMDKNNYPFIPSHGHVGMLECFKLLKKRFAKKEADGVIYTPTFLDCGCGIGNILLLAGVAGYKTTGIECDGKTFRVAKKLARHSNIIHKDITEFKHYHKFDVIFFYVPINDPGKMRMFINKVIDGAKVGSFIIAYSGYSDIIRRDKRFKQAKVNRWNGDVFKKICQ